MVNPQQIRDALTRYQRPSRKKSVWQLLNTLVPLAVMWYIACQTIDYSYWLTLPAIFMMSGLLVRTFIIFHDCGHGSFFRSMRANDFWGILTGLLTITPYHRWRASHARHHGTSGNLDRRGEGDVWMMTRQEYSQAPRLEKLKYRLYRNPAVMFLLGPIAIMLINNRVAGSNASKPERAGVYITNLAIAALFAAEALLFGWKAVLLVHLPALFLAHVAGVWLFYVQHQFEGVYWERSSNWDFMTAALNGGSFYKLPGVLRWFSGNIGFHHIHHLNPRIPNYGLAVCQKDIPELQQTQSVGLLSSFKSLTLRLWDEDSGRMIGFGERRRRESPESSLTG